MRLASSPFTSRCSEGSSRTAHLALDYTLMDRQAATDGPGRLPLWHLVDESRYRLIPHRNACRSLSSKASNSVASRPANMSETVVPARSWSGLRHPVEADSRTDCLWRPEVPLARSSTFHVVTEGTLLKVSPSPRGSSPFLLAHPGTLLSRQWLVLRSDPLKAQERTP